LTRIGVTGHIHLTAGSRAPILRALRAELQPYGPVYGYTCLADGADRLFAEAVHEAGGAYEVVLPSPPAGPDEFLDRARRVSTIPGTLPPEARYAAASEVILDNIDVLVAVWDGEPGGVPGGTAQTVARARARGLPVHVVWPAGAQRAAFSTSP
jgi:hypothetical protein